MALVPSDYPNAYGAQKADSERALFALGREQGVPVATLRPAFIYGQHNPFEREAFFWDRLLAGRPILIPQPSQSFGLAKACGKRQQSLVSRCDGCPSMWTAGARPW